MTIKNVAIAGASGNVGVPLVKALHEAGFQISALTRVDSKATYPSYMKVLTADYTSVESITKALQGQDAVISCLASNVLYLEENLVVAAAAAGVKRFIPGHFSADMRNAKSKLLPILKPIIALQEKLITISQQPDGMAYTFVFTGLFLEMNLQGELLANVKEAKVALKDGGDRLVSCTTIDTIGKGLASVLQHAEETKNRSVYMSEVVLTQNKVISIAKEIDPSKQWEISHVDTAERLRQAVEAPKIPDAPLASVMASVLLMYFGGPDYGMPFQRLDNELLGIVKLDEEGLKRVIEEVIMS